MWQCATDNAWALPAWQWLVALARKSYERRATAADREVMLREVPPFFELVTAQIKQVRQQAPVSPGSE